MSVPVASATGVYFHIPRLTSLISLTSIFWPLNFFYFSTLNIALTLEQQLYYVKDSRLSLYKTVRSESYCLHIPVKYVLPTVPMVML